MKESETNKSGNLVYHNPVIKGFHPDPSVCRAGEDYYLVVSSFEYFPGIPIYHSRDLVNWKQIGNCVTNAEQFPLDKVKDSGGIWAPTIRYYEGRFYVTATLEGFGNFIISSDHPAGKWSDPVWVPVGGIDPSLFFENGRAYYCTNDRLNPDEEEITLEEIDVCTGELLGGQKTLWNGTGGGFMEAPHIYHVGEWYYLMAAEGGTFFTHMITLARSKDIWGPYESCPYNPILTNRHDTRKEVMCTGHGDLLQDYNGNWWIFHLGIRLSRRTMTHLGRETFLTPVEWRDGWFLAGNDRKASLVCEGPLWAAQERQAADCWQADFANPQWEPEFRFLRTPNRDSYQRENEKLYLYPSKISLEDEKNASFAGVCQPDFDCEVETEFAFAPKKEGDEAGLAVLLTSEFQYRFGKKKAADGNVIFVEKVAEDMRQTACEIPVGEGGVKLLIRADKEKYTFFYAVGEEELQEVCSASTRFLACEVSGRCFTGTMTGLYASCKEETDAVMEIENFRTEVTKI